MRITYRTLGKLIARMSDFQLDCDVTVEADDGECFPSELRLATEDNYDSLDVGHPILYVHFTFGAGERRDDIEGIAKDIGL